MLMIACYLLEVALKRVTLGIMIISLDKMKRPRHRYCFDFLRKKKCSIPVEIDTYVFDFPVQDAEGFNAVHHVHSIVLELQAKHEKLVSTTAELVNEYNRREKSLEELFGGLDRLEQTKADKLNVTKEIGIKADKMDLDSKVSTNQFDESFTLLDRSLNDALEKMDNQMSIEDALKETLSELQSKLNLKLDRNDLDSLRDQLESRIREIQVIRTTIKEKAEDAEPAGFRRSVSRPHRRPRRGPHVWVMWAGLCEWVTWLTNTSRPSKWKTVNTITMFYLSYHESLTNNRPYVHQP